MKSNMKKQSYANKLTNSGVRKVGGLKDVEEEKGNVEELLQQEAELESSLLTVDEVVRGPVVPQPRAGDGVPPSFTRFQSGGPGPNIEPVGGLYPGHTPGHTPLNIYSPGSPPLPLPGPLHLVYLQPHPLGFNVIPFQAVGCPTFTPSSPLGFPAHPHHPVVVQSPQLPHPFPPVPPSKPHSDCPCPPDISVADLSPEYGPVFPVHQPPPGFYPPQTGAQLPPDKENNKRGNSQKLSRPWRPWEEENSTSIQADLSNLKIS